jgi:hypothetical protein
MPWTTPKTWSVNEVVTAANMNTHLRDNMSFVGAPPQCSVSTVTPQSIANLTLTALNADLEAYDNDSMHSTSTNNSRITINTAGRYLFCATVGFSNATGLRQGIFRRDGTTYILGGVITMAVTVVADTVLSFSQTIPLTAGQYIEVMARQDSGGNLDVGLHDFSATLISV